ncbi:MAG TPA: PAS domain-containing protein [Bacillus sp. (in: firmicutes)]|uniref:helix-turn-helix transcriptional regulator n=1 Tax=Bacillus litorisediminis TaxID=2922713 RepID=UPI001FAE3198|nr:PAS domain-containing protein [Bacillus litorisediminis]HWO78242.1 PAS domain-containing protein [Bacillus sp. (in: firmicutes)]
MSQIDIDKANHPIFKNYLPIAEGIAKTFGSHCEVVLHDLTDVSSSIVAIFNGHVTGREVGSPMTDLGLSILKKGRGENLLLNYPNKSMKGKKIKSTSIMIRDDKGEIVGCLCINIDLTLLSMASTLLDEMINVNEEKEEESFPQSVTDLEKRMIDRAIEKIGKPIGLMEKNERMEFIRLLDEMGLFLIKGTVHNVAQLLDVSKFTIYNYLEKKS